MPLLLLGMAQPRKFNFVKRAINIRKRTKVFYRKYYLCCISNRPSGLFHLCRNEEFQSICRVGKELAWFSCCPGSCAELLGLRDGKGTECGNTRCEKQDFRTHMCFYSVQDFQAVWWECMCHNSDDARILSFALKLLCSVAKSAATRVKRFDETEGQVLLEPTGMHPKGL